MLTSPNHHNQRRQQRSWRRAAPRLRRAAAVAVPVAFALVFAGGSAMASGPVNWAQYLFSGQHSSDNAAATAITPSNAASLHRIWKFNPPTAPSGLAGFYSSPTVYDGVIYIGARNGHFYAINEATGATIWSRLIGYVPKKTCGKEGFTSTATVAPDPTTGTPTVYVYGPTGYLYAMSTTNGKDVWPPAVVAIPSTTKSDYYAWGSPLVTGGNIYIGISSECDDPLVRGGLDEFSQSKGTLETTFWTTPAHTRGGSIWSSAATDGKSIYVTTSNGPVGSYRQSILKLSPDLSTLQGSWEASTAQAFGGSPGIFSVSGTQMIGACNKNGTFYALATADLAAGPVWEDQIGDANLSGTSECDAAPVFDGTSLYLGSNRTTIKGTTYQGALRSVNPATGAYHWQTGLTGPIVGSPAADGAGVVAAASFGATGKQNGAWVLSAATGQILWSASFGTDSTFAQPVFADNYLILASGEHGLQVYEA